MAKIAASEQTERRIHVLPKELLERIRRYQEENNISSEVEAVRRLLNEALQARDNVEDVLNQLDSAFKKEKDLRVLAKDILSTHVKIQKIELNENFLKFQLLNGDVGAISKKGDLYIGNYFDGDGYYDMKQYVIPKQNNTSSYDPLDDEIPF